MTAGLRPVRASDDAASGRSAAEALTAEAEQAVAALWERLAPGAGSVVATGDLGRRHMAPRSAVELLVLCPPDAAGGAERPVHFPGPLAPSGVHAPAGFDAASAGLRPGNLRTTPP